MRSSFDFQPLVNPDASAVLSAVRERDSDGYTLMSMTGLSLTRLQEALKELLERKLVVVKGATSGPQLGESYVYVPIQAKGYADLYLGRSQT